MRLLPAAVLLGSLITMASCAARDAAPPAAPAPSLTGQIAAEIGDAACTAAAQCRTLALGQKACGGPERYVPWSTARSDGTRLTALAERHAAERRAENERSGAVSNCMLLVDPGAQCVAGRCQLGGGASPAAPS